MDVMSSLSKDLSNLGLAIVHGKNPSPMIQSAYPNYSVGTAIDIYRRNYHGNLHDALSSAYPVIHQLVGDVFFRFLAREFIAQYSSRSANLHHFGSELAYFLTTFAPAQELAYLPDMAVLEWACHCAYFAEDAAMLDISKLAQIPPERYPDMIMRIHPSSQVIRSCYPIRAIWQAHQFDGASNFQIELENNTSIALVSRISNIVQVIKLEEDYAAWLQEIQNGRSLGVATDFTLTRFPEFDATAALLKLARENVLIDFSLGATT